MKNLLFFAALLCLIPHVDLASAEDSAPAPRKITVGAILPLSGDAATVGEAVKNAMTLAYSELSKESQALIEILFEDDKLIPTNTVLAFHKLVDINKADVIVTLSSGTSNAVSSLADREKKLLVAIGASDTRVAAGKTHVVTFWITPEEETRVMIAESVRRGYKKIARICSLHDGMRAIKQAFDAQNNNRLQVVLDEEYPLDIKDFKPYITKLRSYPDIDGVLVLMMPGHLGTFAKQVRMMGVKKPLFGAELFEDANEARISEGALVGAWYVNADDPTDAFLNRFAKMYPKSSLFGASNGYDFIYLLAAAIKKDPNPEAINEFFHTVKNFSGALGTYSASGDNRFTLPAAVKIVTADGFKKLEPTMVGDKNG